MATVQTSGSFAPANNNETDLATVTAAGSFVVAVDVSAMTDAATPDELEVRYYGKARSGDTERLIRTDTVRGAQANALFVSLPILSPHHLRVSAKQTQGTLRTFPWAIYLA